MVIINASKVRLTGKKLRQKMYYRYTGYQGGLKVTQAETLLKTKPEQVFWLAVKGYAPQEYPRTGATEEAQDLRRRRTSARGSKTRNLQF